MSAIVEFCGDWSIFFTLLGLLSALRITKNLLSSLIAGGRAYVLPKLLGPVNPIKAYGGWALVTGCTGGIGREYAMGLAEKGMDVVLVSRSRTKLEDLEMEIKERFGVKTMVIEADFTRIEVLDEIVKKVEGMEIGILINNVGTTGGGIMPFIEMDRKDVQDLITVNMAAATMLCHAILPAMIIRGRGAVVNIGSTAGLMSGPYMAQYAASKHYVHVLTEAIREECKATGVVIQEITPGIVETNLTRFAKGEAGSVRMPTPVKFVASSLSTLGWSSETCGYWFHSLVLPVYTSVPIWMIAKQSRKIYQKYFKEKRRKE